MNDPPLLTLYWSCAFAKQMKPPTLAPYMVALLCMGPCHGQAHTRDPTIGFSPPALLYLRLVIFSAWWKQCLTFPPFFLCHVKRFAVPKLQTVISSPPHFIFLQEMNSRIYSDCRGDEVVLRKLFIAGGLYVFIAWTQHVAQPEGHELTFSKCLCRLLFLCGFFKGQTERGGGEVTLHSFICILKPIVENASILSYYYGH